MKKVIALLLVFACVASVLVVFGQEKAEAATASQLYTAWKNAERAADAAHRSGYLERFASYYRQASQLRMMYLEQARKESLENYKKNGGKPSPNSYH